MADARKPTQRYLSGRVKIVNNAGLHTDRHLYVSPGEVEPNLGFPGEKSVPISDQYFQLITIPNGDTYDRYWQQQPGLLPGGVSVFDEGTLVGTANSVSKINFVGAGVTATASGTISTITIDAPSARVNVSENPPTSPAPVNGDLWWDTDIGELYVYYVDADSAQWVETSGGSETVTISDDPPSGANSGDLWWESDTGRLKIYYNDGDSVQWIDANGGLLDEISNGSGISSVSEDSTPQLGGNLDVNGNSIVSTSNGNISITPNGTGKVILDGLSYPTADGNANQVITTNGSGTLTFADVSGGGSGITTFRFVVSNNTGSIGAGTTTDITITGAKAYSLFKVVTSHAAWVRLYTDTTSRTNDASRAHTTDPTPGSGVLAEVYTTTSGISTFKMTPAVVGWNDDATSSTNIYAKVTNNESTSQDITVSLTILRMEN